MITLGFTGTRDGMTPAQRISLRLLIDSIRPDVFHHGCCVGADEHAAVIVREVMGNRCQIIAHPSDLPGMTSQVAKDVSNEYYPESPPLARNRDIVDQTGQLIACPKGQEELRSGTWATVRQARKMGRPVTVIRPNGEVCPL